MNCIETTGLTHRYSSTEPILQDINLQVPYGSIYGFLGANGAGKTTTLRLLLGLLRKQSGTIRLFGETLETNRIAILRKTGSMIETPSLYAQLTATENLMVLQKIYRCKKTRIAEVLDIVGLGGTGRKRAGNFSLGMKQRLGIAIALLHNPSLLVLDEPTNGLDPEGIIEMRSLLKNLNSKLGMTIIISSHLLSEVERMVTHAGIIHKGQLLFQGTLDQLKEQQSKSVSTIFHTSNQEMTGNIIRNLGIVPILRDDIRIAIPSADKDAIARLVGQICKNNIDIYQVTTASNDLESIFIHLTKTR